MIHQIFAALIATNIGSKIYVFLAIFSKYILLLIASIKLIAIIPESSGTNILAILWNIFILLFISESNSLFTSFTNFGPNTI